MIVAAYNIDENNAHGPKKSGMMFILEPGNIEKLTLGPPIIKDLRAVWPDAPADLQILIAYTPDSLFVAENAAELGLVEAIKRSLERKPVYLVDAESLEKYNVPIKP